MRRRRFVGSMLSAWAATGCRAASSGAAPSIPPAAHVDASGARDEPDVPPTSDADAPASFAALAGFCDGVPGPDAAEYEGHRATMQAALGRAGIGALVVEPGATMTHLTGVQWGRSERPFLFVLPARGQPHFVVPAFEVRRAAERVGELPIEAWQEHADPFALVAKMVGSGRGKIALDPQTRAFIADGVRRAVSRRVVTDAPAVAGVRMRKTEVELARLRRANEATKAALRAAAAVIEPGMRQSEIAETIRQAQLAAGLVDVWVLALAGPAAAFPHGTHEDRVLADGELLLVDTGGALHGYRSDITRTWAVGPVADEVARAFETVRRAQAAALAAMRPGARASEVDAAARAVIGAAGFGEGYDTFTHRLGHGIGLEVHEPPYLLPESDLVLEPGMTMSNEPGIYVPGTFGVRIEDIVAVTEDGAEVFGPRVASLAEPFGPAPARQDAAQ